MTDELDDRLAAWVAPAPSEEARARIVTLLDDPRLRGPVAVAPPTLRVLPLAYAVVLSVLLAATLARHSDAPTVITRHEWVASQPLVVTPNVPVALQATTTAVSTVDLEGFEVVSRPQIRVERGRR